MTTRLLDTLRSAYPRCPSFDGACRVMRWRPAAGYVPRGFCGAIGPSDDVELVLVTAEPGDPLKDERYTRRKLRPEAVARSSTEALRSRLTGFHRGIRKIMDLCYPDQELEKQLRHVWRTNSVLCSAEVEGGYVPRAVVDQCVSKYLRAQLARVPDALVVALGGKAQKRLKHHGIDAIAAIHPSARMSKKKKIASWRRVAKKLALRRKHGGG
jgi:Uracil DNA glycosylase superfamily